MKSIKQRLRPIRARLTLAFILLSTIPLIAFGIYTLESISETVQSHAINSFALSTMDKARKMQTFLSRTEGDVLFLAQSHDLFRLINLDSPEQLKERKGQLANLFITFSNNKLFYEEISYLDETGQQIVKIGSDGQNNWIVPNDELQDKSTEYYFPETMKLEQGKVFVSRLDLDREFGKIVEPFKPVVRKSTPVFDEQGNRKGVVVLFVLADEFLPSIIPSHHIRGELEFVTDHEGYYFVHPNQAKAWSEPFNLNTGHRLQNDYSTEAVEVILSGGNGSIIAKSTDIFIAYAPIFPDPHDKEHFWVMVDVHPSKIVLAPVTKSRNFFLIILVVTTLAIFFLSLYISSGLIKPLLILRKGAEQIGHGDLNHRLTVTVNDEIGALSQEFNSMADRLQESYGSLEQKINERTAALSALNAVSFAVNNSLDLKINLEFALTIVLQRVNLEHAWIFVPEDGNKKMRLIAAVGMPDDFFQKELVSTVETCDCGTALNEGELSQHFERNSCTRLLPYLSSNKKMTNKHISLPIFTKQRTVGLLNLGGANVTELTDNNYEWLDTITQQIGNAIENSTLYHNTLNKTERLTALNRVSNIVSASLELDDVLPPLLREMANTLEMEQGLVVLRSGKNSYKIRNHFGQCQSDEELNRIMWHKLSTIQTIEQSQKPLLIPQAKDDDRLKPLSMLIEKENIKTILLLPLIAQNQLTGFIQLHAINSDNSLEKTEVEMAQTLTNQAAIAIEKARLHEEIVAHYEEELEFARQIQQNLLPRDIPEIDGLRIAGLCQPAKATGGDFYDYIILSENKLGVVVGDVTGKSLPAAMVMALARNTVRSELFNHPMPAEAMTAANRWLCQDIQRGTFVATVEALIDPNNGTMLLVNAGQTATVLVRDNKVSYLLPDEAAGFPLGIQQDLVYTQAKITLQKGDTLLFYTDGIVEAKNTDGDMFGFDRLEDMMKTINGYSPEHIIDSLMVTMQSFVGQAEQHDDITLVVVRVE